MIAEELRRLKEEAAPKPEREDVKGVEHLEEYRIGYRLGFHHALEDAIEIAEDEEDA